jgi:hypothetical protein
VRARHHLASSSCWRFTCYLARSADEDCLTSRLAARVGVDHVEGGLPVAAPGVANAGTEPQHRSVVDQDSRDRGDLGAAHMVGLWAVLPEKAPGGTEISPARESLAVARYHT